MRTTMFGSEDFNVNVRAAIGTHTGDFDGAYPKMQVVDEVDELESIIRPSFFDAM